ncbi:monovalent cation/H(+) antiporter subunit G [Chloroflexota bacterium]
MTMLAIIFMVGGVFFLLVSCLGIIRLPDFYSRTHAVGKSETLGVMLVLVGLAIYSGWSLITLKIFFIVLFILLANPAATHAFSRGALRAGLEPWMGEDKATVEDGETERHDLAN